MQSSVDTLSNMYLAQLSGGCFCTVQYMCIRKYVSALQFGVAESIVPLYISAATRGGRECEEKEKKKDREFTISSLLSPPACNHSNPIQKEPMPQQSSQDATNTVPQLGCDR